MTIAVNSKNITARWILKSLGTGYTSKYYILNMKFKNYTLISISRKLNIVLWVVIYYPGPHFKDG